MIIYRFEKNGVGPFRYGAAIDAGKISHDDLREEIARSVLKFSFTRSADEFPNPFFDDSKNISVNELDRLFKAGWLCATNSLEDFVLWFNGIMYELASYGFELKEIEINSEDVICFSKSHQVIFNPNKIINSTEVILW